MRRSALGYNFYINPFSSRAADVFHYFAYIISATIYSPTNLDTLNVERYYILVCMATVHNCFVNPYRSCVLSENLYPIHSLSLRHQ